MADRILTTHVGALPTPKKLVELAHKRSLGEQFDKAAYDREIKDGVTISSVIRNRSASISSMMASCPTTSVGPGTMARGGRM